MKRLSPKWLLMAGCAVAAAAAADGDSPLILAAKQRDIVQVRRLLQGKADVHAAAADGATALHWAAELDEVEIARLLVRAGADVKAANRYGVAPLALACTNGNDRMAALLLEAGADANSVSMEGEPVLMTAARSGNVETFRTLLQKGADVQKTEPWRGQTALMWAAAEGHDGIAALLLEAGAKVTQRSNGGFTALSFAAREGHRKVAETLLAAGADVNETLPPRLKRTTGATEFRMADGGTSILDLAVTNGHFELAAMLLDHGANPNEDRVGWTPLHTITWIRKPGTGSNDPAPAGSGSMDSLTLVEKLVAKGANVNARMKKRSSGGLSSLNMIGATPFLMAARTADAELMRLLAKLGANPALPNDDGSTPLMVAAGLGTRSPGEDAGTEPEVLEAVKVALELGNDVNAVDKKGETAMHGAAYKQLPSVVKYLSDHGAKVEVWNRKNALGWTPLRIAAGVHRTGNFRASAPTADVFRTIMTDAGVSTVLEEPPTRAGVNTR